MSGKGHIFRIIFDAAVFLILEAAALVMLSHSGTVQNLWISKGVHSVQAFFWGGSESIRDYFSLRRQNDSLAAENFRLYGLLRQYREITGVSDLELSGFGPGLDSGLGFRADSVSGLRHSATTAVIGGYRYIHAGAVKVSNNKQHNYLILDKGSEDGVTPASGVITPKGVVGIIDAVGRHYSYARSFKNTGMVVSARIGKTGATGELIWDGVSSAGAILREIPHHIVLHQGDTVFTSGFSTIFPPDIPLGVTGEATVVNGSTYNIKVKLFTDFSALRYVTIVNNIYESELAELEVEDED